MKKSAELSMILRADCILAGRDLAELSPGTVRIEGDRIAELGDTISADGEEVADFRSARDSDQLGVIVPGLIDGHCHLELSMLAGKMRYRGSLVRWLGELVVRRPKRWSSQARAVRSGVAESLSNGTTTVADISANGRSWQAMRDLPIRKICFAEVVGIGRKSRWAETQLTRLLASMVENDLTLFKGISPHAPYSTDAAVYRRAIELARNEDVRLTTHLAEDPAEVEFIRSRTGPWRTVLTALGVWDNSIQPFGGSPVEWAKEIGLLDVPCLLAHVNYVDDSDIDLLAGGKASVVYCPLAHHYFRHRPHRYREMIAAGVRVALGTDSSACSGSLSILAAMRTVYQAGGLPPRTVLSMGTTTAAEALKLSNLIGSIEVGKLADLVVLRTERQQGSIAKTVLERPTEVAAVVMGGEFQGAKGNAECQMKNAK